jgi:hypothetical protein
MSTTTQTWPPGWYPNGDVVRYWNGLEGAEQCACRGTGVILVEGPCDAAPLEAPCRCLNAEASRPIISETRGAR